MCLAVSKQSREKRTSGQSAANQTCICCIDWLSPVPLLEKRSRGRISLSTLLSTGKMENMSQKFKLLAHAVVNIENSCKET